MNALCLGFRLLFSIKKDVVYREKSLHTSSVRTSHQPLPNYRDSLLAKLCAELNLSKDAERLGW